MKKAIQCLEDSFEIMLEEMAALPFTMIHADLHLDNFIWNKNDDSESLVILDWQSVSRGPVMYDVVSFLTGALRGSDDLDQLFPLYENHVSRLQREGVNIDPQKIDQEQLQRMILVVLAGALSSYGNPDFDTRPQRLQDVFYKLLEDDRFGGIVERMTIL